MASDFSFTLTPEGWMLDGSSPERLAELLAEFEELADSHGAPVKRLAPGLPAGEIRAKLAAVGYGCPDEFAVFYGWHNGYVDDDSAPETCMSLPDMIFSPLDRMIDDSTEIRTAEFSHMGLGPGWILLNQDFWGLGVHLNGEPHQPPLLHWIELDYGVDPSPGAVSLCTIVAWWIMGINRGANVWGSDQWEGNDSLLPTTQLAAFFRPIGWDE